MDRVKKDVLESETDVKDLVVIDNGTETVKIGLSGEDYPRVLVNSLSGSQNIKNDSEGLSSKPQHLFGNALRQAALDKKHDIEYSYPIRRGRIEDLDQMRELWESTLDESFQITDVTSCSFLMIDSVVNSKQYKQKIAEILFEELKIQSLLFMNSATLSLFSTGETTGLVVESGHGLTTVTPVFEGYPIYHAIQSSELAGEDLTAELFNDLKAVENFKLDSSQEREIVKDIKERLCAVALDYANDINKISKGDEEERSYELPDGTVIQIDNKAKYRSSEILFNPSLIGSSSMSLQEMIADSFSRCDNDLKQELLNCVVFCGGNSMLRNFPQRLRMEIDEIVSNEFRSAEIEYRADSLRKYAAWIGGSMIGSLRTFQGLAITKAEYDENPEGKISIVHKRTF